MTVSKEQNEAAADKDELESLGEQLGINVDKRKGLVTIRAMLLDAVDESAPEPAQEAEQAETQAEPTPASQTPHKRASGTKTKGETRKLQSEKTGRVFTWTAALAARKDMKEV